MKKIVLALAFVLLGSFMISGYSKDEILDHYNDIVQSAGAIELTGKLSLEGSKEKGIDDYTGTYTADYKNFSDTEYLFGGTSIKREAGKELSIDCTLEITEQIPTPASARSPTPVPIYMRSTMEYKTFTSCASIVGMDSLTTRRGISSRPRSFVRLIEFFCFLQIKFSVLIQIHYIYDT